MVNCHFSSVHKQISSYFQEVDHLALDLLMMTCMVGIVGILQTVIISSMVLHISILMLVCLRCPKHHNKSISSLLLALRGINLSIVPT